MACGLTETLNLTSMISVLLATFAAVMGLLALGFIAGNCLNHFLFRDTDDNE